MNRLPLLFCLGTAHLIASTAQPDRTADVQSRESFLKRADAAFAARDLKAIAALADVTAWREAGYPELDSLKMTLPPGPLTRYKDLSEYSVLYRDADGRSWRMTLRKDGETGVWKAVVRANPCPRGGTRPGPQWRARSQPTPPVTIWTLLECWPLPM